MRARHIYTTMQRSPRPLASQDIPGITRAAILVKCGTTRTQAKPSCNFTKMWNNPKKSEVPETTQLINVGGFGIISVVPLVLGGFGAN